LPVSSVEAVTVYINSDVLNDFDRLYVFMAHELDHALNIANGNRSTWYAIYGASMSSSLSEASAYSVGAQAANGLGLTYDFGQQSEHDQRAIQFVTGFYKDK